MTVATRNSTIALPADRAELGVHALAQLSDDATLALGGSPAAAGPVWLAARAYGVEDSAKIQIGGVADSARAPVKP